MDVFVSWRDITYEAIRKAGTGGIGKVSFALATNGPNKGVLFAVKVFSPDSPEKEQWKQAFMREVHVLRDCNHPAIVRVFDAEVRSFRTISSPQPAREAQPARGPAYTLCVVWRL